MKITGVAWQGFAVPFRKPYVTSGGAATMRYGLLVFLHADNGLVGVGEASPVGVGSPGEVRETAALLGGVAPRLLGTDPSAKNAGFVLPALPLAAVVGFGIETAMLDLVGKHKRVPVATLLGGGALRPLSVNALIAGESPQEAVAEAREAVAQGFTSLKLKVGMGTMKRDEALVSAVRQAAGPNVRLRIDPNGAWSVSQAIEAIMRLAQYGLEYVEQPVAASDIVGLAAVRRAVPVPIAADEAVGSVDDLLRIIAEGAADVVIVKAARIGGLHSSRELMRLATDEGMPSVVTSSLESGVGLASSVHLAASLPSHAFAHGLATGLLLESDLLTRSLLPQEGRLVVPQGPGLGVEVDMEALERYSIGVRGRTGA